MLQDFALKRSGEKVGPSNCENIIAISSIDIINPDSLADTSGSGDDAFDSSGSNSIPTESELLECHYL